MSNGEKAPLTPREAGDISRKQYDAHRRYADHAEYADTAAKEAAKRVVAIESTIDGLGVAIDPQLPETSSREEYKRLDAERSEQYKRATDEGGAAYHMNALNDAAIHTAKRFASENSGVLRDAAIQSAEADGVKLNLDPEPSEKPEQ